MIKGGAMKEVTDKPTEMEPKTEAMEDPQATIKRLVNELSEMRSYLEKIAQENQMLRATLKAVTQLL